MQVVGSDKSLEAALALVRAEARVNAHVVFQVVIVGEGGAALLAHVGLLPSVFPHVDLQLVLPAGKGVGKKNKKTKRESGRIGLLTELALFLVLAQLGYLLRFKRCFSNSAI